MYKLLLATDRADVETAFDQLNTWETIGFRKPGVVRSLEEAVDYLGAYAVDAIAVALPKDQEAGLTAHLRNAYPVLPVLQASASGEECLRALKECDALLTWLRADVTNLNFTEEDRLQVARHDFFRTLLAGKITDRGSVYRRLKLLRSRMNPELPCVVMEFSLPKEDDYLFEHWHYGSERLEVALRNFFGGELEDMRMLVSVLPGERVMLLCCPMGQTAKLKEESLIEAVSRHVKQPMADIREYLDIDLSIAGVRVLPALTALVAE